MKNESGKYLALESNVTYVFPDNCLGHHRHFRQSQASHRQIGEKGTAV